MHIYAPKRKIKVQNRSLRGIVPKVGHFESTLERDFMRLMTFDRTVEKVYPQPITIPYVRLDGTEGRYTPDGLVIFKKTMQAPSDPILYEIKYRDDLKADRKKLFPKLRAGKQHALNQGWKFCIYTENQIRTPYLKNVYFLSRYKDMKISKRCEEFILDLLIDCSEVAINYFLNMLGSNKQEQANILPYVWHLLAVGKIECDLSERLAMDSIIYIGTDQ